MAGIATVTIDDYIEDGKITPDSVRAALVGQWPFESIDCTITSGGGDYYMGFEIYALLRGFGVPIITRVPEFCASIATVVFLAGDTRLVAPGMGENGRGLIHAPFYSELKDVGYQALLDYAADLKPAIEDLITFYAKNTRLDKATLQTLLTVDTKLSGEQMVSMGFATALYTPGAANPLPAPAPAQAKRKILAKATLTPRTTQSNSITPTMRNYVIEAAQALIKAMSGEPIKALALTLTDGTTVDVASTGDMPAIGEPVTVTATGAPAADGTYPCTDATGAMMTIVVLNGMIADILPVEEANPLAQATEPSTEVAQLQADNARLTEEIATLRTNQAAFQNRVNLVLGLKESQDVVTTSNGDLKAISNAAKSVADPARAKMLAEQKAKGEKVASV